MEFDRNQVKKIMLTKKLVFGVSKNHDKNASESMQTCFCVLQTGNQTHAKRLFDITSNLIKLGRAIMILQKLRFILTKHVLNLSKQLH